MKDCQRLGATFVADLHYLVITHNVLAAILHAAQKLVKQGGNHSMSVIAFSPRMAIHTGCKLSTTWRSSFLSFALSHLQTQERSESRYRPCC